MSRDRFGDPDRDRFDRDYARSQEREPRPRVTATAPVVSKQRGPKFVGKAPCPHCFFPNGVTYHGELKSGQKVYEIGTHSQGAGIRRPGQPVCKGANARLERLTDGTWRHIK